MPDNSLTVKVEADTEDAVESIEEVTKAVRDLEAALESLQETDINIRVGGSSMDAVAKDAIEAASRRTRRNQR